MTERPRPVSPPGHRPEVELLLDGARVSLDSDEARRFRATLRPDLDWDGLLGLARRHGVVPLLYRQLREAGPGVVPARALAALHEEFEANRLGNLLKTGALFQVLDLLESRGIPAVPYKGPTLAAMAFGNLALREFNDLDLLVHGRDLPGARELLLGQGYRLGYSLGRAQEDAHVRSSRQLPFVSRDGLLIELHVGVTLRDFAFDLDPDRLWERLEPVAVAGRDVPTFAAEDLLLILCAHGARHAWRSLGWVCDLAELLRVRSDLDGGRLLERARALRGERLLLLGLALAGSLLNAPVPDEIAARVRSEPVIAVLVAQVTDWLFRRDDSLPGIRERTLFYLRARERLRDGGRFCLGLALTPHVADWETLRLPPSVSFVYPFLRSLRLAFKYALGRPLGRLRAVVSSRTEEMKAHRS
jgi:hypothetical protein